MEHAPRRYFLELPAALLLYSLLLVGSLTGLRTLHSEGILAWVLALLPTIGIAACAWVILRQLRRLDELQRRVQLEALGLSFAGTAFGSLAWGFAENAGAPALPTFAIWPVMAVLWVIGGFIARRRYR